MDRAVFDDQLIRFIQTVKSEFDKNFEKKLKGVIGNSMIRGNNPSLSHVIEDLFAEFLYYTFSNKNYLYLIDVNLSTRLSGESKSKSIRPDIVVLGRETNVIKAIFELKIDDARADDDWVNKSKEKMDRLKKISENIDPERTSDNYIHYTTIKVNDIGEPIKTPSGRFSTSRHSISCSQDATIACITLCKENSRKIEGTDKGRTSGEFAMYLSGKHFNNQNHTLESIMSKENLKDDELYKLLLRMKI